MRSSTEEKRPPVHPGLAAPTSSAAAKARLARPLHPSYHFYTFIWGVIIALIATLALDFSPLPTLSLDFSPLSGLFWLLPAAVLLLIPIRHPLRLCLPLALLSGLIVGSLRTAPIIESRLTARELTGKTLIISGKVLDTPDSSKGTIRLGNLEICSSREACHPCSDCGKPVENSQGIVENSIRLHGTAYVKLSDHLENLDRSDQIILEGKLSSGFGTFLASITRSKVLEIVKLEPGDIFVKFKNFFAGIIHTLIPSPEAELGLGYLMGEKSGLSEDFSERLRAVGMTHVVVASGAHLGILVALSHKIFGHISKFAGAMFALLTVLAFALVVGFTPSMTRAALVAALSIIVGYVGRSFTPLRLLSFVAMLTLLIAPENYGNLGWQLSFASFFGVMVASPALTRFFYGGKKPSWLPSLIITSLSTILICAPILIYNFGTLSLLGLLANLVILPTLPYAMLLVFLTGCLSFLPPLATIAARLASLLLGAHIWLVNFLSDKTTFILTFPSGNPLIFLSYIPIGLLLVFLIRKSSRHPVNTPRREHPKSLKNGVDRSINPTKTQKLWYNMNMIIKTETEMLDFAKDFAKNLTLPATLVLKGDVGAGKTTFTRGLAEGLGVKEPVTSPSFTISKSYSFPVKSENKPADQPDDEPKNTPENTPEAVGYLNHYDFYRLDDPGIMAEDIAESVSQPNSITVVEWGQDVEKLMPKDAIYITIIINEDESRTMEIKTPNLARPGAAKPEPPVKPGVEKGGA